MTLGYKSINISATPKKVKSKYVYLHNLQILPSDQHDEYTQVSCQCEFYDFQKKYKKINKAWDCTSSSWLLSWASSHEQGSHGWKHEPSCTSLQSAGTRWSCNNKPGGSRTKQQCTILQNRQ